jgi:hypothetical protein
MKKKKITAVQFNVLKCSPFAGGRQENVKILKGARKTL